MNAAPVVIPFERQSDPQSSRTCGAACLSMVYRSFGQEIPQAEIWPAIAKQNRFGSLASTTHLMAQDALGRGLAAVVIGARHPLQALRLCHDRGIRVILNHRLQADSVTGHYTVMADLDSQSVVLHDPYFGPSRRLSHAELLHLWLPSLPNSEVAGGVLIAIAQEPPEVPPCQFCHTPTPLSVECPNCKKPIGLQPGAVLGCVNQGCIARMWNYICCPACDFSWDFGKQPALPGAIPGAMPGATGAPDAAAAGVATEPVSLNRTFEELDKFCQQVQSLPGVADNAELQQQLQKLAGSKAAIKLALAEAAIHGQVHQDRLAAFVEKSNQRQEVHRKKVEELNRSTPPLDGDTLGRALLKNLGFTQ